MIQDRASNIFKGKVLGLEKPEVEYQEPQFDAYEEAQQRALNEDGLLRATQPINFNEKIMGGKNAEMFMHGKLPDLGGTYGYTQKVNMLTGKGANRMEEEINTQEKLGSMFTSSMNGSDKINMMLGGQNGSSLNKFEMLSMNPSDKVTMMLGSQNGLPLNKSDMLSMNPSDKVNMMLGTTSGSASDKINKMLSGNKGLKTSGLKTSGSKTSGSKTSGSKPFNVNDYIGTNINNNKSNNMINKMLNNSSKQLFNQVDMLFKQPSVKKPFNVNQYTGIGTRAFDAFKPNGKIAKSFGTTINNTAQNSQSARNNALNKINSAFKPLNNSLPEKNIMNGQIFNMLGNPERTAFRRLNKQKGLPMFGDYDGDKVLNMFDCDPLDKNKQGENDNLNNYIYGDKRIKDTNNPEQSTSSFAFENEIDTEDDTKSDYSTGPMMTPDSAQAQSQFQQDGYNMGNTRYDNPRGDVYYNQENNFADLNKDGQVNDMDKEIFQGLNIDEQIIFAQQGAANSTKPNERKNYLGLLNELYKSKRADQKGTFDQKKWQQTIREKDAEKKFKNTVANKQLDFAKEKFGKELELSRDKFKEAKEAGKFSQQLTRDQFEQQKQLAADKVAYDKRKELRGFNLDLERIGLDTEKLNIAKIKEANALKVAQARLRAEEGKNDRALWESRIRSGQNMLSGLIGGGNKPVDFGEKVGAVGDRTSQNISNLVGNTRGNLQQMSIMSGGISQSLPFGSKVSDSVGLSTQQKSFAQKVNESISNKTPEDIMKNDVEQQTMMQQSSMQPQQVAQPVYRQQVAQPVAQPQVMQYPQQYSPPRQKRSWNNVTPQEAAQVDPQYAKYLAESAGEHTYRRGPYDKNKRQY